MPQRIYPVSYLIMVFQILILSLLVAVNYFPELPKFSHLSFFFLGAGFMLIETKGITEMGLTFGNTWQVIGIVIAGILDHGVSGELRGSVAQHTAPLGLPICCLFAALAVGWYVARSGGFASTSSGAPGDLHCAHLAAVVFGHCLLDSALQARDRSQG